MINKLPYFNVNTDLNITVSSDNNMDLIINFTQFKDSYNTIINDKPIVVNFESDIKYEKIISIFLLKNGRLIIDERFNDIFYYETDVIDKIDKICWFTIPVNYHNDNGLNDLEIYVKGGV